jgi:hypothetical protein
MKSTIDFLTYLGNRFSAKTEEQRRVRIATATILLFILALLYRFTT